LRASRAWRDAILRSEEVSALSFTAARSVIERRDGS
jgi:hypothetical protein